LATLAQAYNYAIKDAKDIAAQEGMGFAGLLGGLAGAAIETSLEERAAAELAATPLPPGWTSDWNYLPSSRSGAGWSWYDPEMGSGIFMRSIPGIPLCTGTTILGRSITVRGQIFR